MSQIKQDPQKLRSFCSDLSYQAAYFKSAIGDLDGHLGKLGDSWQDDQYRAFRNEVQVLKRSLAKFEDDTRRVVSELLKDAEAIEKYQRIQP